MIILLITMTCIVFFLAVGVSGLAMLYQGECSRNLKLQTEITRLRERELPPRRLEAWVRRERGGARGVNLDALDASDVIEALSLVGKGRPFSIEGMRGILTRNQVEALRAELFALGLAEWNPAGRSHGVVFTDDGQAMLEAAANEELYTRAHAHVGGNGHLPSTG